MLADKDTDFGENSILDDSGVLWTKVSDKGIFDLEREIEESNFVATRRIYHDKSSLEIELQNAGFDLIWSEYSSAQINGEPASYQAICQPHPHK